VHATAVCIGTSMSCPKHGDEEFEECNNFPCSFKEKDYGGDGEWGHGESCMGRRDHPTRVLPDIPWTLWQYTISFYMSGWQPSCLPVLHIPRTIHYDNQRLSVQPSGQQTCLAFM
jgi:hypothetical protein